MSTATSARRRPAPAPAPDPARDRRRRAAPPRRRARRAAPGRAAAARAGHLGGRAPRSPATRRRLRARAGAQAPERRPRRPRGAAAMTDPHPRHVAAPAEAILDEVERAVVGKREVLELVLLALLADGHVLLEDVPGRGQDADRPLVRRRDRAALRPRAVHARPAALRRHRLVGLRPAHRELRVPARARVLQPPARRRDQPRPAQDAGRAPGGDGGAPGHRRRRHPPRSSRPSWCWPRRTRSSTRAPTRCPRPSSTASSCAWASATPRQATNGACSTPAPAAAPTP